MGPWSEWTGCEDCTSVGVRTREVAQQAETGGIQCKAFSRAETQSCEFLLNCENSACQYTPWTPWSVCPTTCFRGLVSCTELPSQFRMRSVARPALEGGTPCDWTTLIEQHPCLPPEECAVDQSCVAAPDSPEDCIPCPSVGCTETTEFFTYCTRSILVTRTGAGEECTREQLIYSKTCPLPHCTDDCQEAYGYGQFTTCSQPCGTGWYISATTCPSISTEPCNTQACPVGTMVFSNTTCTFLNSQSCGDDLQECLALCASDPTCNVVQDDFRGSGTCIASTEQTWVWDPTATSCVQPTWGMVNATCLYICAQEPLYSTERGIIFHFNDSPSLSCPITPSLLSSSQACPISPDPIAALIASLWLGPLGLTQLVSFSDPYIPESFTASCPESSDCVYQPWSEAPKWGQCSSGCVNGGIRHRRRAILAPSYFLGIPCNVFEQNEYYACNLREEVTSATEMMCLEPGTTVSEVICHRDWVTNTSNSMQIQTVSHEPGEEMFLYSNSVLTSITIGSYTPPAGFRVAEKQDILDAYAKGFQACAPGWYKTPDLVAGVLFDEEEDVIVVCPPYEFGSTFSTHPWTLFSLAITGSSCTYESAIGLPSFSFAGSITCPWGYTYTGTTCSATVHAACEEGYYYTSRDGGGCALPLDSEVEAAPAYAATRINHQSTSLCPFPNGGVTSNTSYVFLVGEKSDLPTALPFFTPYGLSSFSVSLTSQTYHDERRCNYNESRTDAQLNDGYCFGMSNTVIYDKPCGTARDCSYTAFVDMTTCGECIPPATKIQTRSIARQPSEGGQDCTLPLSTATDCFGPPCASDADACSYDPFPSVPGATCSSGFFPSNQAYFSEWSPLTINAYADYGISNLFNALSSISNPGLPPDPITNDISWALNAQCAPALCLPSISETGEFYPEYPWEMDEDLGFASGWKLGDCAVSIDTLRCLQDRIASYPRVNGSLTGSFVYSVSWNSISLCPYELSCCSWSECSDCTIFGSRTQTVTAAVRGGASCGLVRSVVRNCPFIDTAPTCANSLTCPVTFDGTPCNSQSGKGECILSITTPPVPPFYFCSCTGGNVGKACNNGCPVGSNGLTCSGNGVCFAAIEQCTCNNDWFGPRCDQRGPSSLGMIEMLLYQARMDWTIEYVPQDSQRFTQRKITITNPLQCDLESNAVCAGTLITGNTDEQGGRALNPFILLDNLSVSDYPKYTNICVNETDAGSSWVPSNLMLATFSQVCQDIGTGIPRSEPFNISARFTSHSQIPPSLHDRSFYTSCNVNFSQPFSFGFGSATQHLPCQYSNTSCKEGTREEALFILNGYEGSLHEYCSTGVPQIRLGGSLCDVSNLQVGAFNIFLTCQSGACTYSYTTNPNLPLLVKSAIAGETIIFPDGPAVSGGAAYMGLLLNCNSYPVSLTYDEGGVVTVSLPSGNAFLANYGTFATTFTVT